MSRRREARVLRHINQIRERLQLPAIAQIPRGHTCEADSCPLAEALSSPSLVGCIGQEDWCAYWRGYPQRVVAHGRLSRTLSRFRRDFDAGHFPELVTI